MAAPLTLVEVKRRLGVYADSKVTDELYSFGQAQVTSTVERLGKMDEKASTLNTYAGGLIALLLSTAAFWGRFVTIYSLVMLVVAVFCLVVTGVLATQSQNLQTALWYSDNDWLREVCLTDADTLRRYRVLTMWTVLQSHYGIIAKKVQHIRRATHVLYAGLLILALAILLIAANAVAVQTSAGQGQSFSVGDD